MVLFGFIRTAAEISSHEEQQKKALKAVLGRRVSSFLSKDFGNSLDENGSSPWNAVCSDLCHPSHQQVVSS